MSHPFKMIGANSLLIGGFAAVVFSLYALSISPSIAGGDSGELLAEGCILGIAHPPGYPLFTMMVHALMQLGKKLMLVADGDEWAGSEEMVNNVAFKVNVVSCLFTVGAAYLIGEIVQMAIPLNRMDSNKEGGGSPSPVFLGGSFLAMGLFSFSPLIWQYAVTAEVFPMNTFFAALIVYLVLSFSRTHCFSTALWGAFVCGLALCNQHTIILYVAPLVLWMLILLRHKLLAPGGYIPFIKLAVAFLVGLLPYIYMPLSANLLPENKSMSWGHVATMEGFLHHFLRRDYGTFQLFSGAKGRDAEGFWVRSNAYVNDVYSTQGLFVTPWLALVAVLCWRRIAFTAGLGPTSGSDSGRSISGNSPLAKLRAKKNKGDKNNNARDSQEEGKEKKAKASDSDVSPIEANYTPWVIVLTQAFYFLVFHNLANLPMGDKLLFGVHQRFWMQPNVVTFALCGVGFNEVVRVALRLLQGGGDGGGAKGKKGAFSRTILTTSSPADYSLLPSEESASGSKGMGVGAAAIALAMALVATQYQRNLFVSNQAESYHFRDYARAILTPLPKDSVLIINYDMQWTSVRYVTQCEGFRSDITAINLSMMTYEWFYHKRHLYPDLHFPGTFCGAPNTVATVQGDVNHPGEFAFTFEQFVSANIQNRPIFLGGEVSHPDPKLEAAYDFVPVGLVSRIVPKEHRPDGAAFQEMTEASWQGVLSRLRHLPDLDKYTEETWEWTIGKNLKQRVVDVAAFALEGGIAAAETNLEPLIDATYWIESAAILEALESNGSRSARLEANEGPSFGRGWVPTSVLKNAGLAHMQLVKSPLTNRMPVLPVPKIDHFGTLSTIEWPVLSQKALDAMEEEGIENVSELSLKERYAYDWKKWSAERFMRHWGEFLGREDSRKDPQYDTILHIYRTVEEANKKKTEAKAQAQAQGQTKRKAQKKSAAP